LYMVQLMPLPSQNVIISYVIWFHLPVLAFPGCPGKEAIKMGVVVVGVFYHMTKYAYYYCICSFWCS